MATPSTLLARYLARSGYNEARTGYLRAGAAYVIPVSRFTSKQFGYELAREEFLVEAQTVTIVNLFDKYLTNNHRQNIAEGLLETARRDIEQLKKNWNYVGVMKRHIFAGE